MKRMLIAGAAMLAATALPVVSHAQGTVKIGVISAFSGQFADTSVQIDNGIKLYMKQHGDTVAGKKIEILAGFSLTPETIGAASISAEAKKFMVDMNAATGIVVSKSPYMVRTSFTIGQVPSVSATWPVSYTHLRA